MLLHLWTLLHLWPNVITLVTFITFVTSYYISAFNNVRVVSTSVSILSLVLIATDRYFAIVFPLKLQFYCHEELE